MKRRRTVYLVLGCIFIGLNLFMYLIVPMNPGEQTGVDPKYRGEVVPYMIGHYLAENLFTIIGLFFFLGVYRVNKKINKKKKQELLDSFS